jgi:hypothetical protein
MSFLACCISVTRVFWSDQPRPASPRSNRITNPGLLELGLLSRHILHGLVENSLSLSDPRLDIRLGLLFSLDNLLDPPELVLEISHFIFLV